MTATERFRATAGELGDYSDLALSPDASQVAYRRGTNLYLYEFARGVNAQFTFGNAAEGPAWSPDGSRIGFISIRGPGWGIYDKASNGAGQERLLFQSQDPKASPSWSHDGRFLLFDALNSTGNTLGDLWVLPAAQGSDAKPVPFLHTEFSEVTPRFSPDERWIAYVSQQSGKGELYVRPFDAANPASGDAGGLRQISTNGIGGPPRWRADGKELFYLSSDGNIMAVEVNGTGAAFQAGTPKALFKTSPGASWDVTADGKHDSWSRRLPMGLPRAELPGRRGSRWC